MNNLLFDFTVDKATKTVFITRNLMPTFRWYGMLLPKQKSLTNGWHLNLGYQKQNLWILKLADEDFMRW
jgi:hypothetical protein